MTNDVVHKIVYTILEGQYLQFTYFEGCKPTAIFYLSCMSNLVTQVYQYNYNTANTTITDIAIEWLTNVISK